MTDPTPLAAEAAGADANPEPRRGGVGVRAEVCDRCEWAEPEPDSAFCWICADDYEDELAEMRAKDAGRATW